MGLFSFLSKNKQESASGSSEFYSRAEEESKAVRGRGKRKQNGESAEPVDPVLPEKKRARRRLVGALALVLAAVIGLPMILDSEPKPLADDIAIQIPSKDKPVTSPPPAASSSKVAAPVTLDQKEEVVEAPSTKTSASAVPAIAAGSAVVDAKSDKAKDEVKPGDVVGKASAVSSAAKPDPKSEVAQKTELKISSQAADKVDEARAKAILEGKTDGKLASIKATTDKKSDKYAVQVAALATKVKIDELQGKLNKAGIQSYTQKVATESGDRTRIRVGPFASKEEADKMRTKLIKIGLNGTVVPPSH